MIRGQRASPRTGRGEEKRGRGGRGMRSGVLTRRRVHRYPVAPQMNRSTSLAAAALFWGAAIFGVVPGLAAGTAWAQTPAARPRLHGRAVRLKVDSSPQQATVFWDAGDKPDPKTFGVAGYTPLTLKVPKGSVKI